jgi:NAD(P)-dependent dehydrogenase (short-subunit alcohol dehydrogenase family)
LITGALTGIGRVTALAFGREKARLVVSGRHEGRGQELEKEIISLGAEAVFIRADVRHEDDVRHLIDQTIARFSRLDIAVNNAGSAGAPGPIILQTAENYNSVFETNVLGTLLSMKHELRVMQPQGSGSIVNISSALGIAGAPNVSVYASSKFAVEGLSKCAALEAAPYGIRVNTVAPGPTDTEMLTTTVGDANKKAAYGATMPLGRLGKPEEIAEAILFLTSDKASFITGQSLAVDGGKLAGAVARPIK